MNRTKALVDLHLPTWMQAQPEDCNNRPASRFVCSNDGTCCSTNNHLESPEGIWYCWWCGDLCSPPGSTDAEFEQYIEKIKTKIDTVAKCENHYATVEPVCECDLHVGHVDDCVWIAWRDKKDAPSTGRGGE